MYVYGNTFNDQVEADIFGEIKRRKGWPSRLRAQSLSTIGEGVERKSLAMGSAAA